MKYLTTFIFGFFLALILSYSGSVLIAQVKDPPANQKIAPVVDMSLQKNQLDAIINLLAENNRLLAKLILKK